MIDTPFSGFWAFGVLIDGYRGGLRSASFAERWTSAGLLRRGGDPLHEEEAA
ncbi:hypothetical protein [Acetobacter pasteurianus]|uniref:hypothetical protein n=1 Tax=Acetobacter pasteurianus TaxID=438 RepID=UPI0003841CD7|nr:hypothetical protein [Acetobacter pasteurianus]CCT58813.1 hypothetical protein APA386B_704 [Acetobacter pasteurianus 386B]